MGLVSVTYICKSTVFIIMNTYMRVWGPTHVCYKYLFNPIKLRKGLDPIDLSRSPSSR